MRVRVHVLDDASIQISSGGAEIGQGLLTKVGQAVCSTLTEELGLESPLSMRLIRFREFSTGNNPNQPGAGGSTTSEIAVFAAEQAAQQLASAKREKLNICSFFSKLLISRTELTV